MIRRAALALAAGICLVPAAVLPLRAATDAGALAQAAAADLDAAARALQAAQGAGDRVAALTDTLRAYEKGLGALRESLRRAVLRESELTAELQSREGEIAQLLAVLQTMGRAPAPTLLLHPDGPTGTARSGMILADVAPALNARADGLRARLQEVRTLRALQESAVDQLDTGLDGVQRARTALSQAVSDRTDLPRRFTSDPEGTALLIASAETLGSFAEGLSAVAEGEEGVAPDLPEVTDRRGDLPLPVRGRVLRRAGEADAAGIIRPGIVLATRPRALVTAPFAATIRYRGPLLDYGNVMILEPQPGILLVLAGLDVVYGSAGEVIPEGAPVGLMGGEDPGPGAILSDLSVGSGAERTETLYLELRRENEPTDPEPWFAVTKDTQ
ncbi:murein hydrolase activator EnvC family protein [Pseudooceanicola aestuarii]|uniref:murein hydrolase activator EnvC family protein n=1 Tax=Pseudooceanicola aestuarii TaxID=2697319 RepID=UPI0013D7D915|nr:peptidase M23 [Pseudooceanicola aestuarii]